MSVKASENTNEDDMDRDEDSAVGGNPVKIMKKLISKGKEVGHITYDELNKVEGITNDLAKKIYDFFHS